VASASSWADCTRSETRAAIRRPRLAHAEPPTAQLSFLRRRSPRPVAAGGSGYSEDDLLADALGRTEGRRSTAARWSPTERRRRVRRVPVPAAGLEAQLPPLEEPVGRREEAVPERDSVPDLLELALGRPEPADEGGLLLPALGRADAPEPALEGLGQLAQSGDLPNGTPARQPAQGSASARVAMTAAAAASAPSSPTALGAARNRRPAARSGRRSPVTGRSSGSRTRPATARIRRCGPVRWAARADRAAWVGASIQASRGARPRPSGARSSTSPPSPASSWATRSAPR